MGSFFRCSHERKPRDADPTGGMNNRQPLCASLVSRKPLRHAAPDAIFTQSTPFTQAFFRFLWESWETEAANPGHVPVLENLHYANLLCIKHFSLLSTFPH
jgi:hypothetical protein